MLRLYSMGILGRYDMWLVFGYYIRLILVFWYSVAGMSKLYNAVIAWCLNVTVFAWCRDAMISYCDCVVLGCSSCCDFEKVGLCDASMLCLFDVVTTIIVWLLLLCDLTRVSAVTVWCCHVIVTSRRRYNNHTFFKFSFCIEEFASDSDMALKSILLPLLFGFLLFDVNNSI